MSRHSPREVIALHRFSPVTVRDIGYQTAQHLRYSQTWLFDHAAQVYDAIGALREGVTRPHSRFRIDGIGPVRFNNIIDWLARCGYPTDGLRVPVTPSRDRRR